MDRKVKRFFYRNGYLYATDGVSNWYIPLDGPCQYSDDGLHQYAIEGGNPNSRWYVCEKCLYRKQRR